jgi:hypothetical protein
MNASAGSYADALRPSANDFLDALVPARERKGETDA